MAQHLCIVARNQPLLLGYLNIALAQLSANGDELQIVIDRRPDPFQPEDPAPLPSTMVPDQRRVRGLNELLRTQGYAIVSREDGMSWQLSDRGEQPMAKPAPVYELTEEKVPRAVGRRRALLSALAVVLAVVGVVAALPRDSAFRLGDALVGVAERGTSGSGPSSDLPQTASSEAPRGGESTTPASAPAPPLSATPLPASVAALQTARTAERDASAAPGPAEAPRPAEPERAADPPRPMEPAGVSEPPSSVEPPRAGEPLRALVAKRAADPPGPAKAQRAITPPSRVGPPAAPAARTELSSKRAAARVEAALPAKDNGASPAASKTAEFTGVPRFEMSRERDASGRTAVITVRVTDTAGRPLPSADVRILRQFTNGAVRETQLGAITPVGSYRGSLPNSGPNTDGLVMRVLLGDRRFEVPLAE